MAKRGSTSSQTLAWHKNNPEKSAALTAANQAIKRARQEQTLVDFANSEYKTMLGAIRARCRFFCEHSRSTYKTKLATYITCDVPACPLYAFRNNDPSKIAVQKENCNITKKKMLEHLKQQEEK